MIVERKTAGAALGGRTARACDCCLVKRARWFCAADDAFLCQACDTSVHSANQLASRHERVRLQTSSFKATDSKADGNCVPAWHQGFTRKPRTPRHGKPTSMAKPEKQEEPFIANPLPLVPEIGSEVTSPEENEEQLLYRVPVFDPFDAELCSPNAPNDINNMQTDEGADENAMGIELNALLNDDVDEADLNIPEFLGSDMELAEFAADVETLLSTGLDEAPCEDINIEGVEVVNNGEEQKGLEFCFDSAKVKVEDEDDQEVQAVIACHLDPAIDMAREGLSWDFDYCTSHVNGAEEGEEQKIKVFQATMVMNDTSKVEEVERRLLLRLNYEAVIAAWDSHGCSPWTNDTRPDFNPNVRCWPDILGLCIGENNLHHPYGKTENGIRAHGSGREARVSRYREKRRTRLFSKKIRYEVRKLNAEQRPRIKGRFVKRTAMAGPTFPYL